MKKRFPYGLVFVIVFVGISIFIGYRFLTNRETNVEDNDNQIEDESVSEPIVEEVEEKVIVVENHEVFEEINGQMAYISVPESYLESNLPSIVVYSHGSNTEVTDDTTDKFIQNLQSFGVLFNKSNFVFAASNQHGANWGSDSAVEDTKSMIDWINANYSTSGKVFLLGYSMGGLPTMNFATAYPDNIAGIALLAPTTYSSAWTQARVNIISDIPMQIWHGNSDVNVPYSLSTTFISVLAKYGKSVKLVTLDGKDHWDLETGYMQDVLDYYLSLLTP